MFIYILVGVFSLLSGYLTVLIYEFAASLFVVKAQRAHATNILNMGFQVRDIIKMIIIILFFIVSSIFSSYYECYYILIWMA